MRCVRMVSGSALFFACVLLTLAPVGHTKSSNNVFPKEFHNDLSFIVLEGMTSTHLETQSTANKMCSFPKEDKNGLIKSMPHIKNLYNNDGVRWYLISPAYSTQLLASRTTLAVLKCIFKQSRPVKTTLKNLDCCLPTTKMSPHAWS